MWRIQRTVDDWTCAQSDSSIRALLPTKVFGPDFFFRMEMHGKKKTEYSLTHTYDREEIDRRNSTRIREWTRKHELIACIWTFTWANSANTLSCNFSFLLGFRFSFGDWRIKITILKGEILNAIDFCWCMRLEIGKYKNSDRNSSNQKWIQQTGEKKISKKNASFHDEPK